MPISKRQHIETDQQDNTYNAGYFPLRATRFPAGTPITAKRSKKAYSDLVDQREFLLKMREQWIQKLEDLKEDNKYLNKMKNIKKEEIVDIEPLFARQEDEVAQPEESNEPVLPTTEQYIEEDRDDQYTLDSTHLTINEPEALNAFEELEAIFKSKYQDEEDEDEEEEDEEDEEKARTALNLMLQEFGDLI